MPTETPPKGQLLWVALMVLAAFLGLCTIFVSVVTAVEAWQEHAQASWPQLTARVDKCALTRTSTRGGHRFYIRCRLSFAVGAEQNAANIYSSTVPAPEIPQSPPNQIAPFEAWADEHPPGSPIDVRYDPANHTKVVLVANYMPRGGPQTPNNLKLLEVCAGIFVVLLTIALLTRPQPQSP